MIRNMIRNMTDLINTINTISVAIKNNTDEFNLQQTKIEINRQNLEDEKIQFIEWQQTQDNNEKNKRHKFLRCRVKDTAYYVMKDMIMIKEKSNVPFTQEDEQKKCEIFGIPNSKTCFLTLSTDGVSVGDHIFPIRGALKKTGLHGGDSKWNTVPVCGSKNNTFKKFSHNGWKVNIGYEKLTQEQYNQCTANEQNIYNKIKKWQKYCKSRKAFFCWKLPPQLIRCIDTCIANCYKSLQENIDVIIQNTNF